VDVLRGLELPDFLVAMFLLLLGKTLTEDSCCIDEQAFASMITPCKDMRSCGR